MKFKVSLEICLNFTLNFRKPKFFQFVVYPVIGVQFLKVFAAERFKAPKNEQTCYAISCFEKRVALFCFKKISQMTEMSWN